MIIINGNEVLSDIKYLHNGKFQRTIPNYDSLVGNRTEIFEKDCFVNNCVPYIDYPEYVHVKDELIKKNNYCYEDFGKVDDLICDTGYINVADGKKEKSPIFIGKVCVDEIRIKTKIIKKFYTYGLSYEDYLELYFHYEFNFKISDNNNYHNYLFEADSHKIIKMPFYDCTYDIQPLFILTRKIIPLINKYLSLGNDLMDLNTYYLRSLLPNKDNRTDIHPFSFEDALDIIYNLDIIRGNDYVTIVVGKGKIPYMNAYIVRLINSILKLKLAQNINSKLYKADLPYCLNYPKDNISLRNYIQCILFWGIYDNFDVKKAREAFLTLPSNSDQEEIVLKKDYINNPPDTEMLKIFDFIADIDATCYIDGHCRVGRDDCEWKERTITIPYKNFKLPKKILSKINELLEANLEFQEEKKSKNIWDSDKNHPARYYFFEEYEREYVSGSACRRQDIGSSQLKRDSFYKLLNFFLKFYSLKDLKG